MVGTRRLELLTSTVSIAFCGLDCGLKISLHVVCTNAICKSSDHGTHRGGRPPDARSHTLSPVYTLPEDRKCEHATNEDIFGLAIERQDRTVGNFFGGISNLPGTEYAARR